MKEKKYKSGISLTVIGIVLIILGSLIWINIPKLYGISLMYFGEVVGACMLWVIGGILFITGAGLLIHSALIKEDMKKLEES